MSTPPTRPRPPRARSPLHARRARRGRERAVDYNLRAAEAATAAAAYDEAAARLPSALELGIADPRERARIQVELGFLLNETGRIAESEAILAASLEAAADLEEEGIATRGSLARAYHRVFADSVLDVKELEPGAKQAIETLGQLRDPAGSPKPRRLLAVCRWRQGHVAEAHEELERALLDADASRDWFALRRVVTSIGGFLCDGPVPVGQAVRRCEALLRRYGGDRVMEGVITRCLSLLYAMAGRFDEARAHLERSSVLLDDLGLFTPSWVYRRIAAETKRLLGDRAGEEHELQERWRSLRHLTEAGPDGRAIHAACMLALWCASKAVGRRLPSTSPTGATSSIPHSSEPSSCSVSLPEHVSRPTEASPQRRSDSRAVRSTSRIGPTS